MVRAQSDVGAYQAVWITRFDAPVRATPCAELQPLGGLRFAVKDNIDVQGVPTTAACPAFAYTPAAHATVVQHLLQAGAMLQGKTNLDQFACGLNGTRSPYGAVPNAFNARYVSGGSSAGSAVAVARGEVDFALGTDTAGSGRVPAGLNNIVGLKPSKGLISAQGVVPAAQSVDCVSIFARTVATAVKVLVTAMGYDAQDPYSRALPLNTAPLPRAFKFGVPSRLYFDGDGHSQAAFDQAIERLEALGGERVTIDYEPLEKIAALLYESALVAERYTAIAQFFDAHEDQVIEPVRSIISKGRSYTAAQVFEAQTLLKTLAQRVQPMWCEIDVMLVPTAPTHYTIADMQANPVTLNRNLGAYTNFVNLLDYAALSVPSSIRPDGLPFGVTFIGPGGSDWQLAELGQRYHHATDLTQGATGLPLPEPEPIPGLSTQAWVRVAVVGAHLRGMPLHHQLTQRQARFVGEAQTAPDYLLFALGNTQPPKPGLFRVAKGQGVSIALEIWEMSATHFGTFVGLIPSPLCIGTLQLDNGQSVHGFLCEAQATLGAKDISRFGGWRSYIDHLQP